MITRRNTPAKEAVLKLLKQSKSALSQDVIGHKMKGKMDRVTIYRILNTFCEDGVTHKIMSEEGKYYFALCLNCSEKHHFHNHYHFRCVKCHKIECLKDELKIKLPVGYTLEQVNCVLSGHCKKCA